MRARFFLLGGGLSLVAASLVVLACGETEKVTPAEDAGADVAVEAAPVDAAKDDDAATCDKSADFTDEIPDAAIADGASTSGLCMGCVEKNCAKQVEACNQDCSCQQIAASALSCYLDNGGDLVACAAPFIAVPEETQAIGFQIFTCVQASCKTACATETILGSDAGDGGDGG